MWTSTTSKQSRRSKLIAVVVVGSLSVLLSCRQTEATGVKRAGQVNGHKEDVARAVKMSLKNKETRNSFGR